MVSFIPWSIYKRESNPCTLAQEAEWAPEPVWMLRKREKPLAPTGNCSVLTCMGACVPLKVKCVIETLATECAKVALDVTVALHVSVQ
jgi:hypothetical protein